MKKDYKGNNIVIYQLVSNTVYGASLPDLSLKPGIWSTINIIDNILLQLKLTRKSYSDIIPFFIS